MTRKSISVKDFLLGALTVALLFMLLGAKTVDRKEHGRYEVSTAAAQGWGIISVTDTLTGETKYKAEYGKVMMDTVGVRTFNPFKQNQ